MIERLPHHHLSDHLLLEYANGGLAGASAMLVACHLTLCPSCRNQVEQFEAIGAAVLEAGTHINMQDNALDAVLARLDSPPLCRTNAASPASSMFPRPLLSCLPPGEMHWRRWLPGVRTAKMNLPAEDVRARLVRFSPGLKVPLHDHAGTELLLVLEGEIHEGEQRFLRGDVAISEPGNSHTQRIDSQSPCTALIVNEGPLIPLTPWGRLLKLIAGL